MKKTDTKKRSLLGSLMLAFALILSFPFEDAAAATVPVNGMANWYNTANQYGNYGYPFNRANSGYGYGYNRANYGQFNRAAITVPENATLNRFGTGWTCNDRYVRDGRTSRCIPVPAYATANRARTSWFCNWGYKLNRTTSSCDQIVIPDNATLNYWGTGWYCKSGYYYSSATRACEQTPLYHF